MLGGKAFRNNDIPTPQEAVAIACECSPPDWYSIISLVQHYGSEVIMVRTRRFHKTLLHIAAARGHLDYAHLLIARGADINARDRSLWTPLVEAAANGKEALIAPFIAYGADVDAGNAQKHTALHYASSYGDGGTVRELLKAGGTVNVRNNMGRVPLHDAADVGSFPAAKALLESGALTDIRDIVNETPADAAEKNGHVELAKFLRAHSRAKEESRLRSVEADKKAASQNNGSNHATHLNNGQNNPSFEPFASQLLHTGFHLVECPAIEDMSG